MGWMPRRTKQRLMAILKKVSGMRSGWLWKRGRLSAFIDGKQVVDVTTEGRKLGLRPGVIEYCAPMGIAAWQTEAKVRKFDGVLLLIRACFF